MSTDGSPEDESLEEQQERAVARRRLLKILAAAGGVFTASSALPGKWIRPIVETGILPSHAQASVVPRPLCYTATSSPTPTWMPVCYTPTPSHTPSPPQPCATPGTPRPRSYTATPSSTGTPVPTPPRARRELLERLLAEGRFPPSIADDL
jgi:hypothetical protein